MTKKLTISDHLNAVEQARSYLDDAVKAIQKHFNDKDLGWSLHFQFDHDGVEYIEEHFHNDGKRWSDPLNVYGLAGDGEIGVYDANDAYTEDEIESLSDIVKVWRKEIITTKQWDSIND